MTDAILVLVTAPSADKAAELARTVVEEQLAACGNILPGLRSIYRWEGKVQDDAEALILFKTRAALFDTLRARIIALHPYQVPEVLRVDIADGHAPYLAWILDNTRASP
ncbi:MULTISPECIES: divalent-cation tolerance protein CutA [Myxococcus]|uniref:Divalent-cation tolerance protein CutA n=1 Tax=Myxococcus llanfairpwllgwyngyllgogerychwyrndrobwllllantysiliogogogochensis TaxID=2590453 RepID=A0A540WNZ0_9BACT|nr:MULTISPECIES: divalent-cation tolerance protein CutA [Myxococcus]NTX01442.1 divalent-cation tolerance protein CutA [Myxococcus sp. CA040A]TQF10729.1 divalent-cation tolerance protein CutA [Myxococcus llanfairpwllgwyngyllgogerychwyrndrobwllllantysiliogogogochensis]